MSAGQVQKYHQAAIAYLVYGILYLGGAVYLGVFDATGRTSPSGGAVIYYLMGGLFAVGIPLLIWRGYRWFTRIVALLVGYRVFEIVRLIVSDSGGSVPLPWGGEMALVHGEVVFVMIALINLTFLIRAAWSKPGADDQ